MGQAMFNIRYPKRKIAQGELACYEEIRNHDDLAKAFCSQTSYNLFDARLRIIKKTGFAVREFARGIQADCMSANGFFGSAQDGPMGKQNDSAMWRARAGNGSLLLVRLKKRS